MNTQFNSNVIWLQLEYKISTLEQPRVSVYTHEAQHSGRRSPRTGGGREGFVLMKIHSPVGAVLASAPDRRRRTVGANCKNLPKITHKKIREIDLLCNSLTNFEYQVRVK